MWNCAHFPKAGKTGTGLSWSCDSQAELEMQRAADGIQELIPQTRHKSFQFTGGILFPQGSFEKQENKLIIGSHSKKGGIWIVFFDINRR